MLKYKYKKLLASNPNIGLVLSGGGSRGSYQVGIWKAMTDLGFSQYVTRVSGTSIGAINGAFFVQGSYKTAESIWRKISFEKIFSKPYTIPTSFQTKKAYQLSKEIVRDRGLEVSPLKKMLHDQLDENLILRSPIDLSLVTYNVSKMKPVFISKSQMGHGNLIDYIIASSTFPIFQPHNIAGDWYIDGGVYNNRPIEFFIDDLDIDYIFVIDITIWHTISPLNSTAIVPVDIIGPKNFLGSPINFDNKKILQNMAKGYADGMAFFCN